MIVRAQALSDKNFGSLCQIHCCRIKTFQLSFYSQYLKTIFSVGKFNNCLIFILQTMTVWMSQSHISSPISWKTLQTFCMYCIVFLYSNLQHVPSRVLSIFFTTTLSTNLLLTFLTIAKSASNFVECANRSLTSVVSLAICDPKLASVFKISCTRSGLLSFLRTASCELQPYPFTRYNDNNKKILARQLD